MKEAERFQVIQIVGGVESKRELAHADVGGLVYVDHNLQQRSMIVTDQNGMNGTDDRQLHRVDVFCFVRRAVADGADQQDCREQTENTHPDGL